MRKLAIPADDPMQVYSLCVATVGGAIARQKYLANQPDMQQAVSDFNAATGSASWATLPRVPKGNSEIVVAGTLTKGELVALYDTHMVRALGPSRKVYDDIMVACGGFCPFCGGLGQVHTIDHYLPKANFPAYSILPANLIPCCRDCNTGKSYNFGAEPHDQTLHPYLDDNKYFNERWIVADATIGDPILLKFMCSPPAEWPEDDRRRVNQHFITYSLALRFSVQAGAEITRVTDLRKGSLRNLTSGAFKEYLLENSNSDGFDLNGWSRTMYAALAESEWFNEADFNDPNWYLQW